MRIGDKAFFVFWNNSRATIDQFSARQLLAEVLELISMPIELSGSTSETQGLIDQFTKDLQPDHFFWHQLAQIVQLAFPEKTLAEDTPLAKQVHQFRYVISAYQAQWVREHFPAKSDKESLIAYLKPKKQKRFWRRVFDFDLSESSRLHNKLPRQAIEGYIIPTNMKIVMGFHTEFILDDHGHFANEIDPQGASHNGIINGASFNYANQNDLRHYQLDIAPAKVHDPHFRKEILRNDGNPFRAPRNSRKAKSQDWQDSYFNRRGHFARFGQSSVKRVKMLRRSFLREWKKFLK